MRTPFNPTRAAWAGLLLASAFNTWAATPDWLHVVRRDSYDGVNDDLVTGGLGVAGLTGTPGPYADPAAPTFAELRRAVLNRPPGAANGFGRLFGPNVDPRTGRVSGDGRIAGDEVLAYADDGSGRRMAGLLLQVPRSFDPAHACIVAIATPGSQNVWGDMQRAGYWGLVRGCAVAWADKGLGAGVFDLDAGRGVGIDGRLVGPAEARMPAAAGAFSASHPHRLAYKWAHGGWTQEADWGQSVLRAVEFALAELGGRSWPGQATVTRANTRVIAAGFSNGGGAVLKAAEQDSGHLLDGVVAMSPQIMTPANPRVVIAQGQRVRAGGNRTILDLLSYSNLYRSCAALALPGTPGAAGLKFAANRCTSLVEAGLLKVGDTASQAQEALDRLHAFGMQPEADAQVAGSALAEQSTLGQASQYGRFTVAENLCGLSFAAIDKEGRPRPATPAESAQWFATQLGGTPDGRIVSVINDADPNGPRQSSLSVSRSTGRQDYNFDAALCLRELVVGHSADALRVQEGLRSVMATADVGALPTLIVHGRADLVEPPDFTSRAYLGLNSLVSAHTDALRYIEVTNATHGEPGAGARGLVPLSPYQLQALEALWSHLADGKPLPPSQLVRTAAPSGMAKGQPQVEAADLPPIRQQPARRDRILVKAGRVTVPD
ncbi:D-(-)-3-hydroxybutyrate oligomer hydrolase [Xylophilus rhododendri]|uniref:D-(-)-3-hydroxybutyrate oligomer hydrolase n=1 Tax=Xylophilus rhododendri TaxID=2697032 RepID=A0A857JDY3_9BURK|nr:3-hydroxybutyrate oligomer hydrolase family protein [Xylophilus rhododendri]QHJ00886.1 D-(-)-3-hydroxybutyrate oligomer hydrolase [Xylophilus rhododendri]